MRRPVRGARIEKETTTSVALVRMLLDHAGDLGLPVDAIVRAAGLRAATFADRDARVPDGIYEALFREIGERSGDADFGLHFGEAADRFPRGHVLSAILLASPTVGEALERFFRYHGLLADGIVPSLRRRDPEGRIVLEMPRRDRQRTEALSSLIATVLRTASEGNCRVRRATFTHAEPPSTSEHRRIFECPLEFEAPENGLAVDSVDLDRPMLQADPDVVAALEPLARARLERLAGAATWASRARGEIERLVLAGEKPNVEDVAGALATGGRTLQARLHEEGTTFRDLHDEVRQRLALAALDAGDASLCEIAFLLGFSEQSAFNHAFRRWTGTTPSRYRER